MLVPQDPERMGDVVSITTIRDGYAIACCGGISETATDNAPIFWPGWPTCDGVMEKHHAFASLQQIQKVGLEGLWGFSVVGPPRLKVNARHIVEDQAIIISRQCWAQYFARKRLFDVGVMDGESVKKIKEVINKNTFSPKVKPSNETINEIITA